MDAGLEPLSVRLRDDRASTLVKADDWAVLRASLSAASGEVAGITLRVHGQVLSVLPGGSIIFDEPTAPAVVDAVIAVRDAMLIAAG